jgi:hypothetical protein
MADLRGVNLLGHIADMLINERLYRDLREAADVNDALNKLDELGLAPDVLESVKVAIGWTGRKTVEIVSIRPLEPLPGNPFSGFGGPTNERTRSSLVTTAQSRYSVDDGDPEERRWAAPALDAEPKTDPRATRI